MSGNPQMRMRAYSDLIEGKYIPQDFSYGVQKLSSYKKQAVRILPLAGTSFSSGQPITFRLPPGIIPTDSIRIVANVLGSITTNANAGGVHANLCSNLDFSLFQSIITRSQGRNIDNLFPYYSQLGNLYSNFISEDRRASVRSALVNSVDVAVGTATSTIGAGATGAVPTANGLNICVSEFLGFLGSGYTIDTQTMLPQTEIQLILNPVDYVLQVDTPANVASASYTLSNVYLVMDMIQWAEPSPYQAALSRLSALQIPLSLKFQNFYGVQRSGVQNSFSQPLNFASHCLQKLFVLINTDANAAISNLPHQQDPNSLNSNLFTSSQSGLNNGRFQIGDTMFPSFYDQNSNNIEYALFQLMQCFGMEKDTVHGFSGIKEFEPYLNGAGQGVVSTYASRGLFNNAYYVWAQSLEHAGGYADGMLTGLNTKNAFATDTYFYGNLGNATTYTMTTIAQSAAVLTVLPTGEIDIQY